jgi:hypothetical protein
MEVHVGELGTVWSGWGVWGTGCAGLDGTLAVQSWTGAYRGEVDGEELKLLVSDERGALDEG